MRNILRFGLTAIVLTFVFGALGVTETKAQAVNEILNRMNERYKTLKTLRTGVTMVKFNSQLGESDTTRGTAIYLPQKGRDALVRVDWTEPVKESLAVVNKEFILCRPSLKQCWKGKVDKAKNSAKSNNALAFINMSKEQLKANYAIKYLGEENLSNGIPTWHLELTPKTATGYKMAELWVNANGMPVQMKVIENNNDATTVLLTNFEDNVPIDTKVFIIKPEKSWKIIPA